MSCRVIRIVVMLIAPILAPLAASADPPARVARVSFVGGPVSFRPASADEWTAATLNYPVTIGDHVWTDTAARTELELGASTVRLGTVHRVQRPEPRRRHRAIAPHAGCDVAPRPQSESGRPRRNRHAGRRRVSAAAGPLPGGRQRHRGRDHGDSPPRRRRCRVEFVVPDSRKPVASSSAATTRRRQRPRRSGWTISKTGS